MWLTTVLFLVSASSGSVFAATATPGCEDAQDVNARLRCYEQVLCSDLEDRERDVCLERITRHLLGKQESGVETDASEHGGLPKESDQSTHEVKEIEDQTAAAPASEKGASRGGETATPGADPGNADARGPFARLLGALGLSGRHGENESREIRARILGVSIVGDGQHRVLLDNHEIWEEYNYRRIPLEAGDRVVIRPARWGSYRMQGPSGKITGVRRLDCDKVEGKKPLCDWLSEHAATGRAD